MISSVWDYHSVSRQECAELYGKENHFPPELAYYDWITFSDGDIHNFGRFLRTFQSLEEAKAYAMYYANVNSGGINKETILKQEEESRIEDHVNRIAHYEAYQMYRKYYKKFWMPSAKKTVSRIPAAEAVYICGRQF